MSENAKKLDEFFKQNMEAKEFSSIMRSFMHASIMLNFKDEDGTFKQSIEEGYDCLTQFLEEIDPVLKQ